MASDENCDPDLCGLKLGSSNWFKTKVKKILSAEPPLEHNLEKIFDSEFGKTTFSKMKEGSMKNYNDLTRGENKSMLILPPVFQYNKRIRIHDTVVPQRLQEICNQLRMEGNDNNQVKRIQNFLADIQPQIAECDIFDELALFFYNENGEEERKKYKVQE